ncbi:hypothetical protein [Streptomyces sp. NPDC048172]|uniref:hypothetical protein n=1 Tax=Streptomyces sp. NPDC048172 TaxID=3365505 RepID=UPI0037154652
MIPRLLRLPRPARATRSTRAAAAASALVLVSVPLLSGCSDGGKHKVTYEATGSQLFEVEYDTPDDHGRSKNVRKVVRLSSDGTRKWTRTIEVEDPGAFRISAAGSGRYASVSRVACAVSVDGELKQKTVSKTAGETVWCNADGSDRTG